MPMKILVALVLVLLPIQAFASDLACEKVYELAASAAHHKSKGLKESELRAPLPPRTLLADQPDDPKRKQLVQMHEIVDELFAVPQIDSQVYAVFKAEQCVHRTRNEPYPTFQESAEKLVACGTGKDKIDCAMKAALKNSETGI
jgi:hypothetical protein